MIAGNPCIDAIRAKAGDLSDDEILEIAESIQRRRNRLLAEGSIATLDARLRQAAAEEGDKAKLAAALARRQAAINAIVRDRLDAHVDGLLASGRFTPAEAVLATLEGSVKGVAGARKSVAAYHAAFGKRFWYEMLAAVQHDRPHLAAMLDDRALLADSVREMYELRAGVPPAGRSSAPEARDGGTPGKTGNADAKYLADLFARYTERARTDVNRLGAVIGKLDGWALTQHYDPSRLLAAGKEKFVGDVMTRLDPDRAFPDLLTDSGASDRAAIREVVGEIWTSIVTGRDDTPTAREKGEFVGPRSLARSLEHARVLHYRDADAWLEVHDLYGPGGIFAGLIGHQRRLARAAAQMTVLGPNPKAMLDAKLAAMQRQVRNDPAIPAARKEALIRELTADAGPIGRAYAEMSGITSVPDSLGMAKLGQGIRATQDMGKLGAAVLSAMPGDAITGAANLKFNGKPLFEAYADWTREFFKGRGQGESRELAFLVGEAADGLIGHILSADYSRDGAPGLLSKMSTAFFRWSGLAWETDAARAAGARTLSAWIGSQVGRGWAELPSALRHAFGLHGIDEQRWQAIRAAEYRESNGTTYVTPDRIADLPDHVIDALIDPDLVEVGESGRRPPRAPTASPAPQDFRVEGEPRTAWPADFPEVYVHRQSGAIGAAIKRHPDWAAAKAGDADAAFRLARDLMRPDVVESMRTALAGRTPTVVAVHRADAAGVNQIPVQYALQLADRLGLDLDEGIVQVVSGRTALGRDGRLVQRAGFDGPVEAGRDYLIVDDHATMAGTLADLRAYIENRGGRVLLASTLSANTDSARLAPGPAVLAELHSRFPGLDAWWRQRFGYGLEGLTHAEARHLLRSPSVDALRDRIAQARQEAVDPARPGTAGGGEAPGAAGEASPGGAPGSQTPGGGETPGGAAPTGGPGGEPGIDEARLARLRQEARLDLELSLRRYFADEISFGHIVTDEASRRLAVQGTRPGTPVGEALRFVMHFKGFPIAFTQRVLGRAVLGHPGATASERLLHGAAHTGHLVAGLTVAGYVSMTMKDLAKGWDPRTPQDLASLSKIVGASLTQGGGAGIMGDYLFGEANRFGGGALATLAGPEIGAAAGLFDIWNRAREGDFKAADSFRWLWGNVPFVNTFYVKPALDWLFLDALYESLSPGYLRRQERKRQQDYGQSRL